ncbi:M48 family metallopeptidase [Neptuniibacter sp. PT8_73]|uniref:M48 family metallopeptidase n=1 Tax=unclassified Neptuniibacter TaxID=2630693 RepID=UPI0039F7293E
MNFFEQQDKARRNTGWLVFLFCLAVLSLILITNLLVGIAFQLLSGDTTDIAAVYGSSPFENPGIFSWRNFALISLAVGGVVGCAILYKWWQLSSGGKAVAESLGGVRILPDSEEPNERLVLNVVEEMALASGMPVPPVYLMAHEMGINAFAAGNTPADAVIGVTQGSIEHFKRDELQGVIAHEFSHILNGDMRLNLRLISLLHGIVFIGQVGELFARGGSDRRSDGRVALLGFGLMIVGWLGIFFGKLIKSAVSRQREFLADASAVQFTRNPEGIANALKLIGGYSPGSEINNSHRSEVSHLFFGQAISSLSSLFATHPPIVDRILRVDPHWDGNFLYRGNETRERKLEEEQQKSEEKRQRVQEAAAISAAVMTGTGESALTDNSLSAAREKIDQIPEFLYEQAKESLGAMSICCSLLLHSEGELRQKQLDMIKATGFQGLEKEVLKTAQAVDHLQEHCRLPLIELLLPALKCMSAEQYKQFKRLLMQLIRADKKTDLFEWCLFQLVQHYLAGEHDPELKSAPRYKTPGQIGDEYAQILSAVARFGHEDEETAERAFNRGAGAVSLYNIHLLPAEECDVQVFIKAVNVLGLAYPLLQRRLLIGLCRCIEHDGKLTTTERELITTIAAIMGCPLPKLEYLDEGE